MIFLIIGLISFNKKLAIGLASNADTVAIVAIVAVVVAASRGGRYLTAASPNGFSGSTIVIHLPLTSICFFSHNGLDDLTFSVCAVATD
jgi:hypothetical protein